MADSPTLSEAATRQGIILGTAAYMSPEQARGKVVDKRADIWAFGVVLYEMLTGKALFSGEDVTSTLARVLERQPDFSTLTPKLYPRILFLLERCLEKEVRSRYSSISDARVDIQKVLADPSGLFPQPTIPTKARRQLKVRLPWIAATVAVTALIVGLGVWILKPAKPPEVVRFDYSLPEGIQFSDLQYPALAISPDGKHFVFTTAKGLYLRSLEKLTERLIVGTNGSTSQPFFSPDSKWIGYFFVNDLSLKKIDINGGAPVTLCDAMPDGLSWGKDNKIYFAQNRLMSVSANGGTPEPVMTTKSGVVQFPQILPGDEWVLYTSINAVTMVQSLKSGESKVLFAGINARYLPTGHIVYGVPDSNSLFAVPFNFRKLERKNPGPVRGVQFHHI